ncbi:MAG: bifunctional diaminohydroxyphosphoribosylaminopyrimidine deaminase/5-amino-6-(5-phosphoribosylamino)uracil reductase RibD [Chloroflexi bacterium]|nr:bifunctional diaminohydroxyphosphoribosylaminopyrimidine deaminase/5-amino-6-(5-phosphoribosylamino)uracil reductase RibD [Chloroflexota bacterium]
MDPMDRALELARRALGATSPNPAVGAVLVKDGVVVGEGFTQPPGQAHAEIVALRQAGDQARGATLYVTLEPCCHFGRTSPCASAIIAAGVAEVRYALIDPNPLVSGAGAAQLEAAGIRVAAGEGAEASRKLNEAYCKFITTGMPFVTAKFAASLDGKIATRTGDSRWITGVDARGMAHRLRALSDAVMVGVGTALTDDPLLTARDEADQPRPRQPLRVLVDSHGRTPASARLFREPGPVVVAGAGMPGEHQAALREAGAEVLAFPGEDGRVDLRALLAYLGRRQITSVLAEGGGTLLGSLFDQRLVDKVAAFIAPVVIGGARAVPAVAGQGVATVGQAARLKDVEVHTLGGDLLVTGYPVLEHGSASLSSRV